MAPPTTLVVTLTVLLWAPLPAGAQAPPAEFNRHVLMDVGPLPLPVTCGCVTAPLTVLPYRPGWGRGSGPAAPESAAEPTRFERRLQRERDEQTLASLPLLIQDAMDGHPHAAFGLGLLLTEGTAVERDDQAAGWWFQLAAKGGHPNAFIQLGHRYLRGLGFPPDERAAAYWFYMGAMTGDTGAMIALGSLYAAGRGVGQDWTAALYWWEKAGHWRFVGDAYACGFGVAQDNERALDTYRKGAQSGDASSLIQVGHMHAGGCTGRTDDAAAFEAYKKASDEGYPEAQVALSQLYLEGRGVEPGRGSAWSAYMWARLAELRLEPGELRRVASFQTSAAANLLPTMLVEDAEQFARALIKAGTGR